MYVISGSGLALPWIDRSMTKTFSSKSSVTRIRYDMVPGSVDVSLDSSFIFPPKSRFPMRRCGWIGMIVRGVSKFVMFSLIRLRF